MERVPSAVGARDGVAWGHFVAVAPQNTNCTCPCCGHISADNRKTQRLFACVKCAYEANADHVGAVNALAAGHAVLAWGEKVQSDRSTKQEPTEVTQATPQEFLSLSAWRMSSGLQWCVS
ncbi:zinc ribbon domain-containing protein [Burkholderia pyrrocinia]